MFPPRHRFHIFNVTVYLPQTLIFLIVYRVEHTMPFGEHLHVFFRYFQRFILVAERWPPDGALEVGTVGLSKDKARITSRTKWFGWRGQLEMDDYMEGRMLPLKKPQAQFN